MNPRVLVPTILSAWWTFVPPVSPAAVSTPRPPAAELQSFHFADPWLSAELVAAEPDVVSPVAIAWDAAGRMLVAEMRDYPNATNGGTIRLLQAPNRDGHYEKSVIFADHLPFPNSVLPWNGGVLVTAAPDLIFLKDTDGDGRADERRVLFTGFGTGNQQLRANGLTWGLDGWVYGANGRSDGNVHRPGQTNTHSLRGRDFRFRPDTGEFETLAGRSQFGLAIDAWGNRFLSWNTIPLRHEVFPDRYLARNPRLPAVEVLSDLLPWGDAGQVFPRTPPPLVFNNESGGHFNALAGLTLYQGDGLGTGYRGNAFVGETLRNLVHRRVLEPADATFTARRGEENTEFLRSDDPWFHPANFATGPEGALYVVDFYRQFVEHPDFVPREMRDQMPWRSGNASGRIWRIVRKDRPHGAKDRSSDLTRLSPRALVRQLESRNPWVRQTAHRLLTEGRDPAAADPVRALSRKARLAEVRGLALHLLAILNRLEEADLKRGLRDPDPRVRAQALTLAEPRLGAKPPAAALVESVVARAQDPDPRVRLRAALALGFVEADSVRETALAHLLDRDTNRWVRLAALSSSRTLSPEQMAAFLPRPAKPLRTAPRPVAPNPDRQRVVEQFRPVLQSAGDRARGAVTFGRLCLACHYLQGQGQRVGPDLSGIAARPVDALLVDLLDPSRHVAPEYVAYEVTLVDGETMSGLFASETETRITLRRPGTPDENIPRAQIQSLRASGRSLMPDGLEAGLSTQDLADLLAFLQRPEGGLLP